MRLNVNGFFDVKKQTLAKPSIEFIFFKITFFIFVQKNGPINDESHIYKVTITKMDGTLLSKLLNIRI